MTTDEIRRWLRDSNKRRVVLVEMDYMYQVGVGDSAVATQGTLYFSTALYIDDTASPIQGYTDCVKSVPQYQRSIDRTTLRGKYSASVGSLVLDNSNGALDYLLDMPIDGSDVRIYVGEDTWAKSDFVHLFTAVSLRASCPQPGDLIEIELRDTSLLLDQKIGGMVAVGDYGSPSVAGPNANQFRPVNFGWVHQIAPILLDPTTYTYVHSDTGSSTTAVNVRDNGALLTEVTDWVDNGDGTFTLTANPNSDQITCDVLATSTSTTSTAIGYRLSDAVYELIGVRCGLVSLGKYTGPQYPFLAGTALNDYPVGISISGEGQSAFDVLDLLMDTRNGCWAVDRSGLFYYTLLRPDALSTLIADNADVTIQRTIYDDDVDEGSSALTHNANAFAGYQAYSNKNWTKQDQYAGALSVSDKAALDRIGYFTAGFYGEEPNATSYLGSGAGTPYLGGAPQLYHKTMLGTQLVETLISGSSDTAIPDTNLPANAWDIDTYTGAWISVRRAQHLPWTEFLDEAVGLDFYTLEIGHIINRISSRFGLEAGALFQIVSVSIDPLDGVQLGMVRRRFANTNGVPPYYELREDGSYELREDGGKEERE